MTARGQGAAVQEASQTAGSAEPLAISPQDGQVSLPAGRQKPTFASPQVVRLVRAVVLALVLGLGIGIFAVTVNAQYPIGQWLFWRYAGYTSLAAVWSVGCVAVGHRTLKRALGRTLPIVEHVTASFAVGVFLFFLGMSLAGFLHLFHAWFFPIPPLLMLAVGGPSLFRYGRRCFRLVRARSPRAAPAPWKLVVLALGVIGVVMIYFTILTPENAQFDARWKHLALAEDYAASGAIRRFPEGWSPATYPHLASILYTWAFLLPFGRLFDFVELAAHMEFAGFVLTLVSIPALARRLVPRVMGRRPKLGLAWTVLFLFPGIFLYDASLSCGGDHISAIFAIPIFLFLLRAYEDLSPTMLAFVAMMLAGGGLVKYTGILLLAPFPIAAVVFRMADLGIQSARGTATTTQRRNLWLGPLSALGAGLVFTAPHWLKNIVWYGDPVYPLLYQHLHVRPWAPDVESVFRYGYDAQFWRPSRDLVGLGQTLKALVTYSFVPNDYKGFHGSVPVFGSLFTLLIATLPFLARKDTKRIWALVAYVHTALFVWYWTHHQERYLQAILPLMVAATAATMVLVWHTHVLARIALVPLVALQAIWGGDVYFIPGHAIIRSPIRVVTDLLSAGYKKEYTARLKVFGTYAEIGAALPKGAHVLLHDNHNHLGVGAAGVNDCQGWQFGIAYGSTRSPTEMYGLLRDMGVTHLLWDSRASNGWDNVAGDLMFFDFVARYAVAKKRFGSLILARMPDKAPVAPLNDRVLYLGCNQGFKSGLYRVADMRVPVFGPNANKYPSPEVPGPPSGQSAESLIENAGFAVLESRCVKALPNSGKGFTLVANRRAPHGVKGVHGKESMEIWIRGTEAAIPAASGPPPTAPPEPQEPLLDDSGEEAPHP